MSGPGLVQRPGLVPGRGRSQEGSHPIAHHARHAMHVRGEPGANPFLDGLFLGQGTGRAAPSHLLLKVSC